MTQATSTGLQSPPLAGSSGRLFLLLAAVLATAVLAVPAVAAATVRYAAPGGSGPAPCLRSDPCSLYLAASGEVPAPEQAQKGDEVVALPGEYLGAKGDLGPDEQVQVEVGVNLRGAPGGRATIRAERYAFLVANQGTTISDLHLVSEGSAEPLLLSQSIAERVVVETSARESIACRVGFRSILRDSACIATGPRSAGAGDRVSVNPFPENWHLLHGVTAIGTGSESAGIRFDVNNGEEQVVVTSSIAKGTENDVEAIGSGGGGAVIELGSSDYATRGTSTTSGGVASVTEPGTNGNITAEPLFAADGFHELAGSPTRDAGAIGAVGDEELDLDGDPRVIGVGPDIGADEFLPPTTTALACSPTSVRSGQMVTCSVEVEAETTPAGRVHFRGASADGERELGECEPTPESATRAGCKITVEAETAGAGLRVSAAFDGEGKFGQSEGETTIDVSPIRTTTTLMCSSTQPTITGPTNCSVLVRNADPAGLRPTGIVSFSPLTSGEFIPSPSCALSPSGDEAASCQLLLARPVPAAAAQGLATYLGDDSHDPSEGATPIPLVLADKGHPPPPTTTVLRHVPPHRTSARRAVFAFVAKEPAVRFECKLDHSRFHTCRSPSAITVSRGVHVFWVRAIADDGGPAVPAKYRWVVMPPEVRRR